MDQVNDMFQALYVKSRSQPSGGATPVFDPAQYLADHVLDTLCPGLAEVLESKSDYPIKHIAEYLKRNNPKKSLSSQTVTFEGREVTFECVRPKEQSNEIQAFHRAGEHEVFGLHNPSVDAFLQLGHFLRKNSSTGSQVPCHFIVLVDAPTVYCDSVPWKAATPIENSAQASVLELSALVQNHMKATGVRGTRRIDDIIRAVSDECQLLNAHQHYFEWGGRHPVTETKLDELNRLFLEWVGDEDGNASTPSKSFTVVVVSFTTDVAMRKAMAMTMTCIQPRFEIQRLQRLLRAQEELVEHELQQQDKHFVRIREKRVKLEQRRIKRDDERSNNFIQATLTKRAEEQAKDREGKDKDRRAAPTTHDHIVVSEKKIFADARNMRRMREDEIFCKIEEAHLKIASTRIQSIFRGFKDRKKRNIQCRESSDMAKKDEKVAAKQPPESSAQLRNEANYKLMRLFLQELLGSYAEHLTNEVHSVMPRCRNVTQWEHILKRLPPQYDGDVSSEEESWDSSVVSTSRIPPITPQHRLHNPHRAMLYITQLCGVDERHFIADARTLFAGVESVQRRGYRALEELILLMLNTAMWALHHRSVLPCTPELSVWVTKHHPQFWDFLGRPHQLTVSLREKRDTLFVSADGPQDPLEDRLIVLDAPKNKPWNVASAKSITHSFRQEHASLLRLHKLIPIFVVYDALSAQEWKNAVHSSASYFKGTSKATWLSTKGEPVVYVSGSAYVALPATRPSLVPGHPGEYAGHATVYANAALRRPQDTDTAKAEVVDLDANGSSTSMPIFTPRPPDKKRLSMQRRSSIFESQNVEGGVTEAIAEHSNEPSVQVTTDMYAVEKRVVESVVNTINAHDGLLKRFLPQFEDEDSAMICRQFIGIQSASGFQPDDLRIARAKTQGRPKNARKTTDSSELAKSPTSKGAKPMRKGLSDVSDTSSGNVQRVFSIRHSKQKGSLTATEASDPNASRTTLDDGHLLRPQPPSIPVNQQVLSPSDFAADLAPSIKAETGLELDFRRLSMPRFSFSAYLKSIDTIREETERLFVENGVSNNGTVRKGFGSFTVAPTQTSCMVVGASATEDILFPLFASIVWIVKVHVHDFISEEMDEYIQRRMSKVSPAPLSHTPTATPVTAGRGSQASLKLGGDTPIMRSVRTTSLDGSAPSSPKDAAQGDHEEGEEEFEEFYEEDEALMFPVATCVIRGRLSKRYSTKLDVAPLKPFEETPSLQPLQLGEPASPLGSPRALLKCVERLISDCEDLELVAARNFVEALLTRTQTRDIVKEQIFLSMRECENATDPVQQRLHAVDAVLHTERYMLLIMFYSYMKQQSTLGNEGLSFSSFVMNNSHLVDCLSNIDPWEGAARGCPVGGIRDWASLHQRRRVPESASRIR